MYLLKYINTRYSRITNFNYFRNMLYLLIHFSNMRLCGRLQMYCYRHYIYYVTYIDHEHNHIIQII